MSTLAKVLSEFQTQHLLPQSLFDEMIEESGYEPGKDDESFYTPLYPTFPNYDLRYATSVARPIHLNDFDFNKEEDRNAIVELLRTEYGDNNFETVASCGCKFYRSNIYVGMNITCEHCGDEVTRPLSERIETKVWLKTPPKVSGFLNPAITHVFMDKLNTKSPKVNLVEYWINPSLRAEKRFRDMSNPAYRIAMRLESFRSNLGIDFGYNPFIENIDTIIKAAIEQDRSGVLDLNETNRQRYAEFWERYKHQAISQVLPVPNKITTVVESDQRDRYVSKEKTDLDKFFFTIADMHHEYDPRSEKNHELMGKSYTKLRDVMYKIMESILFKKKGMIRYHAGAGKLPMTGRSIITGESGVCRSDTIIVPWIYGLSILDKHLTNWLYRKGYAPLQVKEIIRSAANYRHPLVEEFFDWIETNRYAVATAGRNPSIQYLSARAFFVKFNRDVEDKSLRIPITCVKEFGADFDGDQMYLIMLYDMFNKIQAYSSFGHQQMLDPNKLFTTSRFATMTKTNLLNYNALLLDEPIAEE